MQEVVLTTFVVGWACAITPLLVLTSRPELGRELVLHGRKANLPLDLQPNCFHCYLPTSFHLLCPFPHCFLFPLEVGPRALSVYLR